MALSVRSSSGLLISQGYDFCSFSALQPGVATGPGSETPWEGGFQRLHRSLTPKNIMLLSLNYPLESKLFCKSPGLLVLKGRN